MEISAGHTMDSIIFDVDGTLWDSTDVVARAWTQYLREKEHMEIEITSQKLMTLFGQLLPDIAKALFPDLSEEEQLRVIDACCQAEHEALLKECAPLYEDLEQTLQKLSAEYPLFIVSNCQAGYIEVFLQATGFSKYFKGHLCPGDTGMAKAENITRIVDDYHLNSPVYVGDTMGDYEACRKAGVPFIFASYGFGNVSEPYAVIQKPMDLIPLCISHS
ncbi:HAD family hydrolase [Blautia sp. HCP3S3_G3]|uniref:HAD family hydrolase n=1 Tax=Blautia sp. HCP3S3_G3 TaxID=3438913 RepID=UPI003F8B7032